jgi:hypothetical protein
MAKRIILGTVITLLVLAVLGGVGAASYGFGMRQAISQQARIVAPATGGQQVTPPLLRGQNRQGLPKGNDPRAFARSFSARPFGATAQRLSPFRLFNPFSAIFHLAIPLLVVALLVVLIMRLLRPGPFWFGGHGHDKMMFVRGGPGGPGPQHFTMPLGDAPPPHFVAWHEQMHKTESSTPPDEAKAV